MHGVWHCSLRRILFLGAGKEIVWVGFVFGVEDFRSLAALVHLYLLSVLSSVVRMCFPQSWGKEEEGGCADGGWRRTCHDWGRIGLLGPTMTGSRQPWLGSISCLPQYPRPAPEKPA